MVDARSVANRFLELAEADGRAMTPMQVLKLVYIAHGWNLGLSGKPLIDQPVEAWQYGPVIRDLYNAMKGFGGGAVAGPLPLGYGARADALTPSEDGLVRQVYKLYGGMSGVQLSGITHMQGTPWQQTYSPDRHSAEIDNGLIADHYQRLSRERVPSAHA
jgi:uncharacterized phage-associated protein